MSQHARIFAIPSTRRHLLSPMVSSFKMPFSRKNASVFSMWRATPRSEQSERVLVTVSTPTHVNELGLDGIFCMENH